MSDPILPFLEWPEGIAAARVPANDNALRNQALNSAAVGVSNDGSGAVNGDVFIVGSSPIFAFASMDENDIALYEFDSWYAWAPVEGTRMVVNDVRKLFDGASWIDDPAGGGGAVDSVNGQTGTVQIDAEDVPYDNNVSGLTATDTQAAIDELAANAGGAMTNPMTSAGDLIYGGVSGAPTRLAAGTNTYVLTMVSGSPAWAAAGGGSLTGFTASLETASPNNTVNASVLIASGGSANQDAVVSPKGDGAFQLHRADNTTAGGNKRGTRSVDLQLSRGAATHVVSGAYGFGAGVGNTVSGQYAAAIGYSNTASGQSSFAFGDGCNATGTASFAYGRYAHTRGIEGVCSYANGLFGAVGDAQNMSGILRRATTGATTTELTTNASAGGTTNQFVLPNNSSYVVKATVVCRENATGDSASWDVTVHVTRGANAASTAVLGSATVTPIASSAGAATWTVAAVADTTNGAVRFEVTGEASHNIKWIADVYACAQLVG